MKKTAFIILAVLMLLSFAACGENEEIVIEAEQNQDVSEAAAEESTAMPDSLLYYGEVMELKKAEDGSVSQIYMNSQAKGEMLMNVSAETVFIDSGNFCGDETELNVGDRMYVFHSPVMTMSLPSQSAAFAIVRNIPMDARCAMYHEIEEVSENGENLIISTDNGKMEITAEAETEIVYYNGDKAELKDIEPGGYMMVIYREEMNQPPENPTAFKIMLLK